MYQRILLAYDGSSFGEAALREGAELARLCGAELHLLGVTDSNGGLGLAATVGVMDVLGSEGEALQRSLESVGHELHAQGLRVLACVRQGDPVRELDAYVRQQKIDLLVLGHSGKGLLARWLQGSVGAEMLKHLPCSLLVVKTRN
jgi:nucleotide-binding universal stress UspA family protein